MNLLVEKSEKRKAINKLEASCEVQAVRWWMQIVPSEVGGAFGGITWLESGG